MPKKFFDIIPPHLVSEMETKVKDFMSGKKDKKHDHRGHKDGKRKISLRWKRIFILSGSFFILLVGYLYFSLASLDVEIWPKTELVTFEQKVTAQNLLGEVDLENKMIPAQFIEEEKELWQEFSATGSSSNKGTAEGIIRVYNKYNPPKSFSFVAKTRFLSDSGKLFRSVSKISLPAAKLEGGKIVPSWVDVRVIAAGSGESYNIGPAKFSLPGLAGTSSYYAIYGESSEEMAGGYESESKIVTSDDIENAKESLEEKLFNDTEEILKNRALSSNLELLNNVIAKNVIESSCSVKVGAEVEKFSCSTKVKVTALVFKEADLRELAEEYIISQSTGLREVLTGSLTLEYVPETIDLKLGEITLNLVMSAETYLAIDLQEMSLSFRGNDSSRISDIIYSKVGQELSQIKINFWPFWVKKAPNDQDKIKVRLNFE